MTANELADELQKMFVGEEYDRLVHEIPDLLRQQEKELTEAGGMIGVLREQLQEEIQARADALDDLNSRMMKFMKSYNEMAYKLEEVGGAYTHPVKELTNEDRSMLIRTLKWSEDLLRIAGHDEAVSDVQDCLMILRKAQEK